MEVFDFLKYELLGISVWTYLLAFFSILGGFILKRVSRVVIQRLIKAAEKSKIAYDEIVLEAALSPLQWFCTLVGIWVAVLILPLPSNVVDIQRFVFAALRAISVGLLMWFGLRLVDGLTTHWQNKAATTDSKIDDQIIPILRSSSKVFLVIIGIILVLQNLGYSVASLVAGLGLGGAAVVFASKDTVANLFGSLVIFLDRPFHIGDSIEVANAEGVVEEVGLRTTRLRTFGNSQLTLPNAIFTTNSIQNHSRRMKRRLNMSVGLTYETSPAKMREAVEAIRTLIDEDERFYEGAFVYFDTMSGSSLDIMIYCFTRTVEWRAYLETKQDLLLTIMDAVESLGLHFAYPTQTLHVESLPTAKR